MARSLRAGGTAVQVLRGDPQQLSQPGQAQILIAMMVPGRGLADRRALERQRQDLQRHVARIQPRQANYSAGMIPPTLITWAITTLPAAQRGTGTGLWMAASFLGQFLSPVVVLALRHVTGSLSGAILVYALACAVSALTALACLIAVPRMPSLSGTAPPLP